MRPRHLIPVAALPLVVALAAPAQAAVTVSYEPIQGYYQISGDDAANVLAMTCVGGNTTPISAPNAPCADVKTIVIFPGDEVDS
ncbi:MAG TPA: hypothetical protein VLI04_23325, partial [Nocardioidaceae bacterium]|nr:hypothetical protein [Nocardioidaceae bacterium]